MSASESTIPTSKFRRVRKEPILKWFPRTSRSCCGITVLGMGNISGDSNRTVHFQVVRSSLPMNSKISGRSMKEDTTSIETRHGSIQGDSDLQEFI